MNIKKYKIKLTYRKTGFVRLFSHLDIARFLERALRRADLPFYLTKGFNPHPKISFYSALKLGEKGENYAVLYFEKDCPRATLSGDRPGGKYRLQWFDPRNGVWLDDQEATVTADPKGRITLPDFPSNTKKSKIDWAVKLTMVR